MFDCGVSLLAGGKGGRTLGVCMYAPAILLEAGDPLLQRRKISATYISMRHRRLHISAHIPSSDENLLVLIVKVT